MVEPIIRGGDVALFIDWENFKISLAAGNRTPNLSSLKEEVSNQGRVVVAKAYADWVTRAPEMRGASQFIYDPPSLYAAGIEPVFVPTRVPSTQASTANGMRTYRVKNSVDVKMTADCIECAHSYPNIGTFVLVSGDSDFLHVVNALRSMGKRVVVIGVSWSTSRRFADQVDSLLLYDKDVDPIAPQPAVLAQHTVPRDTTPEVPELAEVVRAIEEIIRDERAAGGQPLLTSIKQRMMRRYPSFDEKKLGFSGFKKLMARAAEDGNIKLIHSGLVDWAIMAEEEVPEGTTEEVPSGVAARPGRRRGGRRRHGAQRDDGAEGTADDVEAIDADPDAELEDLVPEFADSLEETAATDFDLSDVEESDGTGAELLQDTEDEEPVPWFDVDEEVGAAPEFAVEQPSDQVSVSGPEDGPAPVEAEAEPETQDVFGNDEALAAAVREAMSSITLPPEPEDGQDSERISDLLVMADHLEHHHGTSHVAYNFLIAEVCTALEQGLAAGNDQIARHWGDVAARDYVGKVLRGLSDGGFFRRSTYTWREEGTGRRRQRNTLNLVRENELVGRMLTARLGPAANSSPPVDASVATILESGEAPVPEQHLTEQAVAEQPASDQPASDQELPPVEQLSLVNGSETSETEAVSDPAPAQDEADEEFVDEPQPRNVRRRPFTSRLLRS